jgi:murein DD-endopeptidase MepM/ murein hydrolase activator NlpD
VDLPRSRLIEGYGRVFFFTRNYGTSRTGTIVVTRGLTGPLKGHRIRYMHLGAVRPDLRVGSILEPGEELGLMGGTAILDSLPHVHIDIETPDGLRVDVEKLFGIDRHHAPCG